jgi:hypothetical protein
MGSIQKDASLNFNGSIPKGCISNTWWVYPKWDVSLKLDGSIQKRMYPKNLMGLSEKKMYAKIWWVFAKGCIPKILIDLSQKGILCLSQTWWVY